MARISPFEATAGPLAFSALPRGGRRYLALLGEGSCLLRGNGGPSYFRSPLILSFPDAAAARLRTAEARGVAFSFSPSFAAELAARLGGDEAGLLGGPDPVVIRVGRADAARFLRLFEDVVRAWERGGGGNAEAALTAGSGLLVRLRRIAAGADRPDRSPRAADAASISAYLDRRFRETLSLESMAADLGFSPSYLSRYFRRSTGRCLFEYLNSRRIAEACALLKSTDRTVTEIAFEVGYNNLSFFNRYFRKLMEASPQEFRRRTRPRGDGPPDTALPR